jgi:hypothetical protein
MWIQKSSFAKKVILFLLLKKGENWVRDRTLVELCCEWDQIVSKILHRGVISKETNGWFSTNRQKGGNGAGATHIFLPEDTAPTAGGGGGAGEEVQRALGVHVVAFHFVYLDPAGVGPHLPHLVDLGAARAVRELERAEDPAAAVAAELGGEVGRRVGEGGPRGAERGAGDAVGLHLVRAAAAAAAAGDGHQRLRAVHALALGVQAPGDPPAGGRRGRQERHRQGRRRGVVGPVQRRAEAGQVGARLEHAVAGQFLRRAGTGAGARRARGRVRRRHRGGEDGQEEPREGHGRGRARGQSCGWGRNCSLRAQGGETRNSGKREGLRIFGSVVGAQILQWAVGAVNKEEDTRPERTVDRWMPAIGHRARLHESIHGTEKYFVLHNTNLPCVS